MNAFIEKWNTISEAPRRVAIGWRVARPCASCGSTTVRAEGNIWVCDHCTPESAQVQDGEADAHLAQAVQVLNRAGAHIDHGNGCITITLPQQSDNAMTRQAVRTLYGDACEVVVGQGPQDGPDRNSQKGSS